MSIQVLQRPAPVVPDGGVAARRAMMRWALRLFRREWRQQLLVLALMTVAVAAMIVGVAVATAPATPGHPSEGAFGSASAMATLQGSDPHLAADISAVTRKFRPATVVENENLSTGTTQQVQLRSEQPNAPFSGPMLSLVSGRYPSAPGEVALTSGVAGIYGARTGGTVHLAGRSWRITGIVQDPSNLDDEFALVEPGQIGAPSTGATSTGAPTQVTILINARRGSVTGLPSAAAVSYADASGSGGINPAVIALAASVLGLVFIGLVAMAGFTVMAQRRMRALGMVSSLGATERNVRLVMVVNGFVVGLIGVILGSIVGFGVWLGYAPHLQNAAGHVVHPLSLPWWALITGMILAVVTSTLAARQPAKAVARVPVIAALSGRPPAPRAVHRSAVAGLVTVGAGLFLLFFSGGWGGSGGSDTLFLLGGLVATVVGMCLLAGICVTVLAAAAGPRSPVAIRIALRDLVRYRSRSGSALGAVSFAVFLAMLITLIASFRFSMVLDWTGANMTPSQFIVYTSNPHGGGGPNGGSLPNTNDFSAMRAQVNQLSSGLHATSVLPLYQAVPPGGGIVTLSQAGTGNNNFSGQIYVATPALLKQYGITSVAPRTDILTMRPGMASLPRMLLLWGNPNATTMNQVANPPMQTAGSLPSGTSAPNTVLTMHAVDALHLRLMLSGWFVQLPRPLTATQVVSLRSAVNAAGGTLETKSGELGLRQITNGATIAGIFVALSVLAMSVGLIRSETARDLRTLAAAGAPGRTRRAITSATAGALALLGAVLGSVVAVITLAVWARGNLSTTFGQVPWTDVVAILVGLPVVATIAGWLLAGRQPAGIARQPLE
jgi:putative ABC transport system permease protein